MSSVSPPTESFRKLAVAVGFLALAVSALLARGSPTTGYELSIYTMTPTPVWAGLVVAMAIALAVAFLPTRASRSPSRDAAVVLGGLAVVVFAGLPSIRGYRYFGHHDALTHLGWARGIADGTINPFEMFYPGIHTLAVMIHSVLEIPLSRAMAVGVIVSMLVFCTFVTLTVWTITERPIAAVIAAFSTFLLLPVTTVSMYLTPHAMSQAVFFSALLLYLATLSLRADRSRVAIAAVSGAFGFAAIAAVVYHPQLLAHFIVAVLAICAIQFLSRRILTEGTIASQTPLYTQALFLIGLFLVWTANHGFFAETIVYFLSATAEFALGEGGAVGGSVQDQGTSLAAVGGSIVEIFFKLFTPQFVFVILAAMVGVGVLVGRRSAWLETIRPEVVYFSAALVALVPVFFAYFFASGSSMYFRVFGLMMVFVTILGSLAIYGIAAGLAGPSDGSVASVTGHPAFAVVFAMLLVVSLAAVFPSPYTYTGSPHVSEATMSGYETAFDDREEDVDFLGLRDGPNRFDDAVNGNEERSWEHIDVSASELRSGLAEEYDEDRYLVLTRTDTEREVGAYHELRYTAGDLAAVETQPEVDRIHSNGEFDRYYVHEPTPQL